MKKKLFAGTIILAISFAAILKVHAAKAKSDPYIECLAGVGVCAIINDTIIIHGIAIILPGNE